MAHPLDEAQAKVARARVHFEELYRQTELFLRDHPYEFITQDNRETGLPQLVAKARGPEEPIPDTIGTILGDFFHNLRSALNYLAWRISTGSGAGDTQTQFPITFDAAGRTYKKAAALRHRDSENRYLSRVRNADRALIERLQPYHGGRGELLQVIAHFNDMDKHRVIPVRTATVYVTPPTLHGRFIRATMRHKVLVELHDGAVLAELVEVGPLSSEQVEMSLQPPRFVLFGEPTDIRVNLAHLKKATRWVELILFLFRTRW